VFIRKDGQRHRLGGWGYLFDQAGSAYDVGKDAFRCALAVEDGMMEENRLSRRIEEELGGKTFANVPMIYKKGRPYIASFAKLVVAVAEEGETCALEILRSNAQRLALLIKTGIARYGKPTQFVAGGGFLKSDLFRSMVEEESGIQLVIPDLPPVYGACIEALRQEKIHASKDFKNNFTVSYRRIVC
jgi:N-acetylglucosamine kinase-like BadF-type ATPase